MHIAKGSSTEPSLLLRWSREVEGGQRRGFGTSLARGGGGDAGVDRRGLGQQVGGEVSLVLFTFFFRGEGVVLSFVFPSGGWEPTMTG